MPATLPPLSDVIQPLICGTATFNTQYNADPFAMPTNDIIAEAFKLGVRSAMRCYSETATLTKNTQIRAFDTSPYYGPSETLLGAALSTPYVLQNHPRESYQIITKAGRIGGSEFDYSPAWVRYSIQNSLKRLHTPYLDVVYCHDVEFVTPPEVLAAVKELRRIRDEEGTIRYVGISGYPVPLLCELAELILKETGEPLDAVMSYANYTLQNTTLATVGLERLRAAGVSVVPNASPLGMGLLRQAGVPIGGKGDFHPAPQDLRAKVATAAKYVEETGERLETVSIRWALESWATVGARVGAKGQLGVSVMGVSNHAELEETMRVWSSVLDGLENGVEGRQVDKQNKEWSLARRQDVDTKADKVQALLGEWKDFAWPSPDVGYVNVRAVKGVIDQVEAEAGVVQESAVKDSRL